jgi:hypothetical protein
VVFLVCFFAGPDGEETAGEVELVKIGEGGDGREMERRHPMSTVASAPAKTSGMAVGTDKRNGGVRRDAGDRRVNWRDFRYFRKGNRSSIVCASVL